jgi:hypothetical protein
MLDDETMGRLGAISAAILARFEFRRQGRDPDSPINIPIRQLALEVGAHGDTVIRHLATLVEQGYLKRVSGGPRQRQFFTVLETPVEPKICPNVRADLPSFTGKSALMCGQPTLCKEVRKRTIHPKAPPAAPLDRAETTLSNDPQTAPEEPEPDPPFALQPDEPKPTKASKAAQKLADPQGFAEFWALYPRKEERKLTAETYRKSCKTRALQVLALQALQSHLPTMQARIDEDKSCRYIKMPWKWLKTSDWESFQFRPESVERAMTEAEREAKIQALRDQYDVKY